MSENTDHDPYCDDGDCLVCFPQEERDAMERSRSLWDHNLGPRNAVTVYRFREPGFNGPTPAASGNTPAAIGLALTEYGHAIVHTDGWPVQQEHFSLFGTGRSRDHLDVFFCEVGWSGAADAENGEHPWWTLPRRQTAAEAYFNVEAGTFS